MKLRGFPLKIGLQFSFPIRMNSGDWDGNELFKLCGVARKKFHWVFCPNSFSDRLVWLAVVNFTPKSPIWRKQMTKYGHTERPGRMISAYWKPKRSNLMLINPALARFVDRHRKLNPWHTKSMLIAKLIRKSPMARIETFLSVRLTLSERSELYQLTLMKQELQIVEMNSRWSHSALNGTEQIQNVSNETIDSINRFEPTLAHVLVRYDEREQIKDNIVVVLIQLKAALAVNAASYMLSTDIP